MSDTDTENGIDQEAMDDAFGESNSDIDADTDAPDERPDPADLDPITKSEAEYKRDAEGNLLPIHEPVKYDGEWRRISIKPLVPQEASELEDTFQGRGDVGFEEFIPFLDAHIIEPSDVDWGDAKLEVIMPCVKALNRQLTGGENSEFYQEVEKHLEERSDDDEAGN